MSDARYQAKPNKEEFRPAYSWKVVDMLRDRIAALVGSEETAKKLAATLNARGLIEL